MFSWFLIFQKSRVCDQKGAKGTGIKREMFEVAFHNYFTVGEMFTTLAQFYLVGSCPMYHKRREEEGGWKLDNVTVT